jgi:hypothetical protein
MRDVGFPDDQLDSVVHKIKWSPEEDANLLRAAQKHGTSSWVKIAAMVPGRTSKQCRERWLGQLSPGVVKANWTPDEDRRLLTDHIAHGNQWTIIAQNLPGRSAISIKNRWSWLMRHGVPQRFCQFALPRLITDVTEHRRKATPVVLDTLLAQDDLFGEHFREFQAKMMLGL